MIDEHPPGHAFGVLLVCTANRCRSPMAQFLLQDALTSRWPMGAPAWRVQSAALQGQNGRSIDPSAGALLSSRGIDATGFRSSELTLEMISDADLVLTATRKHRGRVVTMDPTALHKTFTLAQFGYLLSGAAGSRCTDPVAAGSEAIERAANARALLGGRTDEDDIPDPVGKPMALFNQCAARIDAAVGQIVSALPALA